MSRPQILISNDDGIHSPGLRAAVKAASVLGDLVVVAPSHQQTGMGRSLKAGNHTQLHPFDFGLPDCRIRAFHCDCTPALAVHHGLNVFFADRKPELVIAGINYGENLGTGVTASGTVGAAMEGADCGVPALAVSKQTAIGQYHEYTDQDWTASAHFLQMFASLMLENRLPGDVDLLKVDIPDPADYRTPWRLTRLSRLPYWVTSLRQPSPDSRIDDTTVAIDTFPKQLDPLSDVYAITVDRVVSVTPLTLDLTARTDFEIVYRSLNQRRSLDSV
jgi:5'-nucleotidase